MNNLLDPSDGKVVAKGRFQLASEEPQRRAGVVSGLAYGLLAALGWGVGLAAARHGFSVGFEPLDLLFIRYAVATPILVGVFCLMRRWERIAKARGAVAAALAFFGGPALAICEKPMGAYWPSPGAAWSCCISIHGSMLAQEGRRSR